jgi:succinoglycan biosynthesis protein ExoO
MTLRVSVIITAYNVEGYIERAIQSALNQSDIEAEVIVVDDASTDNTWAVINSFSDPRVAKKIKLENNGGPSVARNAGIAAATGDWIAILDGDDAYEQDRLMKCLTRAQNQNADIVVDNLTVCPENGDAPFSMFPVDFFNKHKTLSLADFIAGNRSFLGGYSLGYMKPVFSGAFLRLHGLCYDAEIRIGEDYLLMAQALACGALCVAEPTAGYRYTVRSGSISQRLNLDDIQRIAACDKKLLSRYKLDSDAVRAQKIRDFYLNEAYGFTLLVEALKAKDIKAVLKAFIMSPTAPRHLWRAVCVRIKRILP